MFTKLHRAMIALGAATALSAGCGVPPEDEGAGGATEVTQQAVMLGNWAGPFLNGAFPEGAFRLPNVDLPLVCEGRIAGQSHAGKLWGSTCRFEWGDKVQYHGNYKILMPPATGHYELMDSPGFVPSNAVMTEHDSLIPENGIPVCLGAGVAWGKVWNGSCRYEWGDRVYYAPGRTFRFLVHVP
jgi:hypothetical protein